MKTLKGRGAIISLIWISLTGCAADPVGWDDHPTHAPLPAYVVTVPDDALVAYCHDPRAIACALRVYALVECFIYLPEHPYSDSLEHERKHCAGYDHAAYQPTPLWNVDVNGTR